jgi:hypothetical protein
VPKAVLALALVIGAALTQRPEGMGIHAQADGVDITSSVTYNLRADDGPRRVSWDVKIVNNDPATSNAGGNGIVRFYEEFPFPVLADARNLAASSTGEPLNVSTTPIDGTPVDVALVRLSAPLFYGETASLSLNYEIADTRKPSLLIMPSYAFVPVVAVGDSATVAVSLPSSSPWASELVAAECPQEGPTFRCAGSDGMYLAALAEVSRPDLVSTLTVDVPLREKTVSLAIKYFQGEEAFAQHVKDLATNALPVMEELYGVPYSGPKEVQVEERGRVVTLGYEGLALCSEALCSISVSPVADDYTVLHELAHLWSPLYSKRWLLEGFADFVSRQAASRMPPGLVSGAPTERTTPSVELKLDEWGDVNPTLGLDDAHREIENTGYHRSERLILHLQSRVGEEIMKKANEAIAATGGAADSKRYMDALEEAGGGNQDDLFMEWVFPSSFAPTVAERRQARDRLAALTMRATAEGLPGTIPDRIHTDIANWQFPNALARLDEAEVRLEAFAEIKEQIARLRADTRRAGLAIDERLDQALAGWDFDEASEIADEAGLALRVYREAEEIVAEPRNAWEKFGLIGSDPEVQLREAEEAFNAGDYDRARDAAQDAIDEVNGASEEAARRVLLVAGGAAAFAVLILLLVWYGHLRDRRMGRIG